MKILKFDGNKTEEKKSVTEKNCVKDKENRK